MNRRQLNILVAVLGLIITFPLMIIIAILIKLTSKGPIIYSQQRVGLNRRSIWGHNQLRSSEERRKYTQPLELERRLGWYVGQIHRRQKNWGGMPFRIYKFRTMTVASPHAAEQWAKINDIRVTPIGKILRKYRLDELPQLYNVLKGEMNVVGPRPEQLQLFGKLNGQVFGYDLRQRELPGITGLAQVSQHPDTSIEDVEKKLGYDLKYITKPSIKHDIYIMLKTIPVMLFKRLGW